MRKITKAHKKCVGSCAIKNIKITQLIPHPVTLSRCSRNAFTPPRSLAKNVSGFTVWLFYKPKPMQVSVYNNLHFNLKRSLNIQRTKIAHIVSTAKTAETCICDVITNHLQHLKSLFFLTKYSTSTPPLDFNQVNCI